LLIATFAPFLASQDAKSPIKWMKLWLAPWLDRSWHLAAPWCSWHYIYIEHLTNITHEWKRHACDAIGFAGMVPVSWRRPRSVLSSGLHGIGPLALVL
jgi:hypothetical protein